MALTLAAVGLRALLPVLTKFATTPQGRQVILVISKNAPRIPVLGKLVPIGGAAEMLQAQAESALARKADQKVRRRKKFNEKSRVITLEILKEVLEKECGDGRLIYDSAQQAVNQLVNVISGGIRIQPPSANPDDAWAASAGGNVANRIMEAARDRVLKQTAPRARITYRYSKRAI
jgi:hypothetical protein